MKNVVGVLEGSGPLADETVVVGAHYDHLGLRQRAAQRRRHAGPGQDPLRGRRQRLAAPPG